MSGKRATDTIDGLCAQFSSGRDVAEVINDKFSSHFHLSANFTQTICSSKETLQVPFLFVYKHLRRLNTRKSSPDLPCFLCKAAAHIITEPLTALFNESLESKIVPFILKSAAVTAVPKYSVPIFDDLHPISLLPIPIKILEHFILKSIKSAILHYYGRNQFRFRPPLRL